MEQQRPRAEFTDVDHAAEPRHYVQCLDFQNNRTFMQMYKQRTFALLDIQPGQQILDVGTGLGQDALEMAKLVGPTGQVTGLDFSQTMVQEAQKRSHDANLPVTFCQGDVHHLAFADNTFDRCRADRTFQHLPNPRQALSEMMRVTKPGGKLLIVDPDHETRVVDTPYPDITQRFLQFRNSGLQQPGIAHQLYALFKETGLLDVAVEPVPHVTTDYATIQPVARFVEGMRLAQQHGVVTAEEADRWIAYLDEAVRTGRFFHAMTYFITVGRKPA
jgi:ubiquinone/menaquinone biosynthesis C-methylase UbiE